MPRDLSESLLYPSHNVSHEFQAGIVPLYLPTVLRDVVHMVFNAVYT